MEENTSHLLQWVDRLDFKVFQAIVVVVAIWQMNLKTSNYANVGVRNIIDNVDNDSRLQESFKKLLGRNRKISYIPWKHWVLMAKWVHCVNQEHSPLVWFSGWLRHVKQILGWLFIKWEPKTINIVENIINLIKLVLGK